MIRLVLYEFRQIWRHRLTWILLILMIFTVLFLSARTPLSGQAAPDPYQTDFIQMDSALADIDAAAAPDDIRALDAAKALMAQAAAENQSRGLILDGGASARPVSLSLDLLRFTQSGLLILVSLGMGLVFSGHRQSPALRRTSILGGIIARSLALTLSLAVIFLLPQLAVLGWASYGSPSPWLDLSIPFNPRAGSALYRITAEGSVTLSGYRSITAASLTTLGKAYGLAFLYEVGQMFAWSALGLLLADLFSRRSMILAAVTLLLTGARSLRFPSGDHGFFGFLFFAYHDALRDTLGSFRMMRGLAREEAPFDYFLGLAVLLISGILILYLTQLRYQGKLRHRPRGGTDDEDV